MATLRSVVPSRSARRLRTAVALVAIGVAAVSCGAASAHQQRHGSQEPSYHPKAQLAGGSTDQQTLLNQVVSGLGSQSVVNSGSIDATPPPNQTAAAGQWLDLTVNEGSTKSAEIMGEWQALLVMGAFRDLSWSNGDPVPVGLTTMAVTPTATSYDSGGSTGPLGDPPTHSIPTTNTTTLTAQVTSALAANGLTPTSISYLQPDGTAVIVTATTKTPDQTVQNIQSIQSSMFGSLDSLEGEYFEVDDQSGAPIWIGAHITRLAAGIEWFSPSVPGPGALGGPVTTQSTAGGN